MFLSTINPAGTRKSRIKGIVNYRKISNINEQIKIFSKTGVSVKLGDHTWPELPWSEFDDSDLKCFELQIEIEAMIRRIHAEENK